MGQVILNRLQVLANINDELEGISGDIYDKRNGGLKIKGN